MDKAVGGLFHLRFSLSSRFTSGAPGRPGLTIPECPIGNPHLVAAFRLRQVGTPGPGGRVRRPALEEGPFGETSLPGERSLKDAATLRPRARHGMLCG